ncbi:MAG: preprotein translocase subunit SecG [Pseudomonadales bacterium]|nr:preprotein translocase subunit SecG [Pseudomonadales bacterium]
METIVLVVSIVIALALIVLIMMQQGKGADMGASFGSGSSQTLFGGQGSGNLLTHVTAILAAGFFLTSFGLAMLAKSNMDSVTGDIVAPAAIESSAAQLGQGDLDSLDMPNLPQTAPVSTVSDEGSAGPQNNPDLPVVD